jgi:flagellar biosynthesis GTPase FlhF
MVEHETREPGSRGTAVEGAAPVPVPGPRARLRPGLRPDPFEREVAHRLTSCGAGAELVERVRAAFAAAPDDGGDRHAIDRAAEAIGGMFVVAHSPRLRGATRVPCFVGPSGGGKTASLVKLATRLVRAGRRVELATIDARRVGAVEALRAHAQLLGVPCHVLREPADAARLARAGLDALLIDTGGRSETDLPALSALRAALDGTRGHFDAHLVLPASASRAALAEAWRAFAPLGLAGAVLTQLDETRQPAPLLAQVLEHDLAVALLANGPELGDLVRASGERFADLLLRGRLA